MTPSIILANEQQTQQLATALAQIVVPNIIIGLKGDLGAGKTALCRYLIHALGYQGLVKSPTYGLIESYLTPWGHIHHLDLYRLSDPEELMFMGWQDYVDDGALKLIEWPEKAGDYLSQMDVTLDLMLQADDQRRVSCQTKLCEFNDLFAKWQ